MVSEDEALHMRRALAQAERGRGRTSPNPMVGAVVVAPDGAILGSGYHERAGQPHAEIVALAEAGDRARGATLYCSLEPCAHTGRTGPCVEAIVAAGIRRVVAAVEDPNPLVQGRGLSYLRQNGIEVHAGLLADEAARLNDAFFTFVRRGRPFVTLKIATSLDGKIAGSAGRFTALTSEPANRRVHALRAEVDAIAIGSGTMLADDPLLTARHVYRERPLLRVVFDTRLRTSATARLFSTLDQGPVLIVTTEAGLAAAPEAAARLREAGAEVESLEERSLGEAMTRLAGRGITSLLLEGGAELHAAAWAAGVVDRVQIYVAPCVLGDQALPWLDDARSWLSSLRELRAEVYGPDVLIEGYVHRPH